MNGFIKLQRDVQGTWIHKDARYLKAWIDVLMNVNYSKGVAKINGKVMMCGAGESLLSLDSWAAIFGKKDWNKEQVRRFFKRLATQHYISTIGDTGTTRLRVLESVSYKDLEHATTTTPDTQPPRHPTTIKEEEKEEELKDKDIVEFLDVFNHFKLITGKKVKIKSTASLIRRSTKYRHITNRLKEGATVDQCKQIIKLKNKEWKDNPKMKQYIRFETIFNKTKFESYLDELGDKKPTFDYTPPYPVPPFVTTDKRNDFFYARISKYHDMELLDERLFNTEYKKRGLYGKDAESLCYELEQQNTELSKIEIKYQIA